MKVDNSEDNQNGASEDLFLEGYQKAINLLESCNTEGGFLATNTDLDNYRRIWGRDGCITGFYVADLAAREKKKLAERYLTGIYKANSREVNGQSWSFPEFLHGKEHSPGGTPGLTWNAASAIIAREALRGNSLF